MKNFVLGALAGAYVFMSSPSMAGVETYDFDQAHTQIIFFVDHLGFSKSQGEFHQVDGTFTIDRDTPENSVIDVSVQTDSIDMDLDKWTAHMKNEDFFDVEKYPAMTFKSTDINIQDDSHAKVTGDFTLLGVTKPVTLDVVHNKSGIHPFSGKYVAGFSAKGAIKRSDFGMTYGVPGVGDQVDIVIEVEGLRRGDSGAQNR